MVDLGVDPHGGGTGRHLVVFATLKTPPPLHAYGSYM